MATQKSTHPAPEPGATVCATPHAITGYTAAQLTTVLETIASRARTLDKLLMMLQGNDIKDAYARAILIDAAQEGACAIGAIADDAIGGAIYGDANCWNYGPNFADAGKAVTA